MMDYWLGFQAFTAVAKEAPDGRCYASCGWPGPGAGDL